MIPNNVNEIVRFVVTVLSNRSGTTEKETFVFDPSTTLQDIANRIFQPGLVESRAVPYCIELSPDIASMPNRLTLMDSVLQTLSDEVVNSETEVQFEWAGTTKDSP
jgi:hypothetical protein